MDPTFSVAREGATVRIADPIENARFELHTPTAVELGPGSPEAFYFPVDSAVSVETGAVVVPKLANVLVRTRSGDLVADTADHVDRSLDPGAYDVELSTAPMKLYLSVERGFDVRHDDRTVTLDFGTLTEVEVGARSFHDRPAGTVTTTADPVGAMNAVSLLGSALKTTSPERSFPTLRGHPPLVELGDAFEAPAGVAPPDTGVRVELPTDYEYVYPAASLAYYLGAEVVPGAVPRLVTDEGFEYALDGPHGYEETVGRVLQQTFFFDCVTRTEGYYRVDLHERRAVEPLVDLDFAALYDRSPAERLEAYLSVPFDAVAEHVPDWNLTTDVTATPDNVEVLPFAANDLALVRCPGELGSASATPPPAPVEAFFRSDATVSADAEDFTRGTTPRRSSDDRREEIFNLEPAETVEHAWVGEGFPLGANKATVESYRRRVERSVPEKTGIDIHVVCNDERMAAEGVVEEFYGLRDMLTFDVSVHSELATDELRELLARPSDLLHYIGHVDDDGIRCPDGHLDAAGLSDVNATAFVLNACRSYAQGEALVEAGSYGGVVTLAGVANSVATDIGRTLSRLLNCGFPLRVALSVVKDTIAPAYQYITVGDGGLTLCQSESGGPLLLTLDRNDDGTFRVTQRMYPGPNYGLGTMFGPNIDVAESTTRRLISNEVTIDRVTPAQLDDVFELERMPVRIDGGLVWSDEISASEL